MPADLQSSIFDNYKKFLTLHCGQMEKRGKNLLLRSTLDEFNIAYLTERDHDAMREFKCVHLMPWSSLDKDELLQYGYVERNKISFMTLENESNDCVPPEDLTIECDVSPDFVRLFSEMQSDCFIEDPSEYAKWHSFINNGNIANRLDAEQHFYVAYRSELPAGICLSLQSPGVLGLYAVGTLFQHRNKGVATALVRHSIGGSRRSGSIITLQVYSQTPAHGLYKNLGFEDAFTTNVFYRN